MAHYSLGDEETIVGSDKLMSRLSLLVRESTLDLGKKYMTSSSLGLKNINEQ